MLSGEPESRAYGNEVNVQTLISSTIFAQTIAIESIQGLCARASRTETTMVATN
jgi:hypothetical protein